MIFTLKRTRGTKRNECFGTSAVTVKKQVVG